MFKMWYLDILALKFLQSGINCQSTNFPTRVICYYDKYRSSSVLLITFIDVNCYYSGEMKQLIIKITAFDPAEANLY